MPTYHPAYLLRNQALSEKRRVWEDMLQVMEKLALPISEKQRDYFLKDHGVECRDVPGSAPLTKPDRRVSLCPEALELVDEGAAADAEGLGGLGAVEVVLAQRLEDGLALDFGQALGIWGRPWGLTRPRRGPWRADARAG